MCAYLGETPTLNNINPLKQRIPLPNWRITFDGIGKIKSLRKYIKKLSFTHAYRSNFSLGNYTTNLSGDWDAMEMLLKLILLAILFHRNKL